ncbi:tyrosine-type recombinase/integrase [Priestia megaterium]|uniref:tyrosine-type recombinase/integrase n=1 Tax=Priestia megaterium TaxID=1404 RepID=UPI0028778ECD|nr:tyrosine-type recombinase/integrase [Priestia megaterium]
MKRENGIKMIQQAFQQGVKMKDISEETAKKYTRCIGNFFNTLDEIRELGFDKKSRDAYNPKFWKGGWVDKHFNKMYERFHGNGKKPVSGSYIESTAHAFGKLQQLVNEHDVWKNAGVVKVRVGLKGSIESESGRLYQNYLHGASASADESTSIKASDKEYNKILQGIEKVIPKSNPNYQTIKNVIISQRHTGGRITVETNLKVGDINLTNMTKYYNKDKNDFSRRVPLSNNQKLFYRNLTQGKAKGSPLFPLFDTNNKQMDKETASKYMQNIYKKVAESSGLIEKNENGKVISRYTSHSTRRVYAQGLYDSTRFTSSKKLDYEIKKYINNQGSNKEGIIERIQKEKVRLNYYRIQKGLPMKDFTWNQKRKLLVMLHLGHSRTDICRKSYIVEDLFLCKTPKKLRKW